MRRAPWSAIVICCLLFGSCDDPAFEQNQLKSIDKQPAQAAVSHRVAERPLGEIEGPELPGPFYETTTEICTGTNGYNAICGCMVELSNAIEGLPTDLAIFTADDGPDDPLPMFQAGGSLNIPVACRAGRYLLEDDPTWFDLYFDYQRAAAQPGFMGSEILSALYGPPVVGSVIAVLDHARTLGHTSIVDKASEWLRVYWAVHALVANMGQILDGTFIMKTDIVTNDGNDAIFNGASVGAAGSRADKSGTGGPGSLTHPLLTLALDVSPRRYDPSLANSPGYYYGLRVAVLVAGYTLDGNGRVNLGSLTPAASVFGITEAERALLHDFVQSQGTQHLGAVLDLIGTMRPTCDMTFLRTTEGVASWFGTSTTAQRICNRNKGPYFAARLDYTGSGHYLHPTLQTNPSEGGESYRQGSQICAALDDGTTRCMDLPGGTVVYEISWIKNAGIQVVAGDLDPPESLYALRGPAIHVDGQPDEFSRDQVEELFAADFEGPGEAPASEDDLSAIITARWADDRLGLFVTVRDDQHDNDHAADDLWQGDSLQIAFDVQGDGGTALDEDDLELGFALIGGQAVHAASHGETPAGLEYAVTRNGARTHYELSIPLEALFAATPQPGDKVGFSLLINEADGNGRDGWLAWSGGIATEKVPADFGALILSDERAAALLQAYRVQTIQTDGRADEFNGAGAQSLPASTFVQRHVDSPLPTGDTDYSATIQARWTTDRLALLVEVTDDVQENIHQAVLWRGDSLQLALDPDLSGGEGWQPGDWELGLALVGDQVVFSQFHGDPLTGLEYAVVRNGSVTTYEVSLPLTGAFGPDPQPGDEVGFALLAAEADDPGVLDQDGRDGWLEFGGGVGFVKRPDEYARLRLNPTAADVVVNPPDGGMTPDGGVVPDSGSRTDGGNEDSPGSDPGCGCTGSRGSGTALPWFLLLFVPILRLRRRP